MKRKWLAFSIRNGKELLRDPLTIAFSLGFPLVLLLLLTAIQANIPVNLFTLEQLAPGIVIFGLSFMTLFSATLIAKDRESALLKRLYATPLSPVDFIFGYACPILPLSLGQGILCYLLAMVLGLHASIHIFYAIVWIAPISILYVALGLLCGSVCNVKQVSGLCGALLTNVAAWLSDTWFDLDLVGGGFKQVAYALPFVHGVELERAVLAGDLGGALPHAAWVLGYGLLTAVFAVYLFLRQMREA